MRIPTRATTLALVALFVSASLAYADYGSRPPAPPKPETSSSTSPSNESGFTAKQQADQWYRDAYKDVEKGSKDLAAGNKESAEKKFRRALERSRRATELDSTHHEAWNLVGFTSRKLGDYPTAFAAYTTAIRLKPDYAQAREYYGEGLLETGDLAGARKQLAALEKIGDAAMTAELRTAIAKYEGAHVMPASPADSTAAHGGK